MKKSYIKPLARPEVMTGLTLLGTLSRVDNGDLNITNNTTSGDADARGGSFWDDVD